MVFAVALLGVLAMALTSRLGLDYTWDAAPAIAALARGDLHAFAGSHFQMGPLPILGRAPVLAVTGDTVWGYRLGSLLLFGGIVWLVWLLARRAPRFGLTLAAVLAVNPVTLRALELGHPEEPLGAALCVGALVLALEGRARPAAIVLGLALATKQWALFAVLPVLLALPGRRREVLLVAGGIAAAFTLPVVLADPGAYVEAMRKPATGLSAMRPGNLWNLVAVETRVVDDSTLLLVPGWLRVTAHPGIVVLALALPLLLRRTHLLAVLALVFLARCALDPWNHEYYHWPFLASLAAYEVLVLRRAPILTAVSSALLWVVFARMVQADPRGVPDLLYLTWAAGMALALWRWTPSEHQARWPTPSPLASSDGRTSTSPASRPAATRRAAA